VETHAKKGVLLHKVHFLNRYRRNSLIRELGKINISSRGWIALYLRTEVNHGGAYGRKDFASRIKTVRRRATGEDCAPSEELEFMENYHAWQLETDARLWAAKRLWKRGKEVLKDHAAKTRSVKSVHGGFTEQIVD